MTISGYINIHVSQFGLCISFERYNWRKPAWGTFPTFDRPYDGIQTGKLSELSFGPIYFTHYRPV